MDMAIGKKAVIDTNFRCPVPQYFPIYIFPSHEGNTINKMGIIQKTKL